MQTARGEAEYGVACFDPRAVDHLRALDEADAGAREVELLVAVDPGKLGALPAEQRAARGAADLGRALHELCDLLLVEAVGGDVVEQEERLRTGAEHVVDAVGGQVGPTPAQLPCSPRQYELRADAVCRRGQQAPFVEREQSRKPAEVALDARRASRLDRLPQPRDDRLGRRQ